MSKSPQSSASTRTLHLSFMAGVVIYGLVAYLAKTQIMGEDPGFVGLDHATYTLLLYAAAGLSVILTVVALVLLPKPTLRDQIMARLTTPVEDTPAAKARAYHILRVAVIETIAILGLVLFLLNGNLTHLWWFLGAALGLLVVIFPEATTSMTN